MKFWLTKQDNAKTPEISSTFCVLPWIHQATRTYGAVAPCCVSDPLAENLNKTTFSKAWNSLSVRKLRKAMLKGKKSSICQRCYNEEKEGIASHRTRSNRYWKSYYSFERLAQKTDEEGFFEGQAVYLDLRLGNKCNLECVMCGPQETVRWESLLEKIYGQAKTFKLKKYLKSHQVWMKIAPSKNWHEREDIQKDISRQIPFLKRVTIAGGEPLMIKAQDKFLDECIAQKESHHISLHYHSNGSVLKPSIFEKWRHFESVMFFFSLDDLKERNHYIRYPCSWARIERNMEIIDRESPDNVHPLILCTLQATNIFYFEEFLDGLIDKNFKKFYPAHRDLVHVELVHQPYFLSCQILPPKAKQIVSEKFDNIYKKFPHRTNRFKSLIRFMNAEDKSEHIPVFKDYMQALDKARGTNFSKTFPELAELMEL